MARSLDPPPRARPSRGDPRAHSHSCSALRSLSISYLLLDSITINLRSLSISYLLLDSITINLPLLEKLVLSATEELRRVVIIAPRHGRQ